MALNKDIYGKEQLALNPQLDPNAEFGTIGTASLAPVSSPNFQSTPPPPTHDISGIDTTLQNTATQLSPAETEVQKRLQDIQTSNNALLGKTAYTQQQEIQQGLPELQKAQQDLAAQIKGYQLESQNLQNQYNYLIPNQKIQDLTGRASVGGIQGETEVGRRSNLLAQGIIASKALIASAAFEAARGNVAMALSQVQRAVDSKFGPDEERIRIAKENLELLLRDPRLPLEQQKRANAQLEIQKQKEEKLAQDKENSKTIQGLALQAVQNGAPSAIITAITSAKNIEQAIQAGIGYLQKETASSIQEYQFAVRNGYKGTYTQYQDEDANRKKAIAKAGAFVGGLPNNIAAQVDKLSASFDSSPIVKTYNEVQNKKLSVDSIINSGVKGPGDLAIVYEFMKGLDPTSVVRESEYATAATSGNIFMGWAAKFNGYLKEGGGFLPEHVRKDFQTLINKKLEVATQQYQNLRKETARKINIKTNSSDGLDYLTNYEAAIAPIEKIDTSTINSDIQTAIHDIRRFPTRESLIDALIQEYRISKEEAAKKVYSIWKDNTKR